MFLVRHPQTDWNQQRRYQGRTGRPCTGRVEDSARAVNRVLRDQPPEIIVSSSTSHARKLAQAMAHTTESKPATVIDDAWREVDHGAWEGLMHDQVIRRFGADAGRRFEDPGYDRHGGETLVEAGTRVAEAWRDLVDVSRGTVAVITHATPIRLVLCRCLGLPLTSQWRFRVDPLGVTRIELSDATTVLGAVNCRQEVW